MSDFIRQSITLQSFGLDNGWIILSPIEASIKSKIETAGVPLKDWDISIYRGILTGFNEAFIINQSTKDELVKRSAPTDLSEIIRPILRGRDIEKYKANWANLYLIYIPWHFPMHNDPLVNGASVKAEEEFKSQYPLVYEHLLIFKQGLSNRNKSETGIRYEWYALQRWGANYTEDFSKQKIVWKRVGSIIRFSYDESGVFCLDSTCFATGKDLKFLIGYLNSTISKWELLNNSPKTGTGDVITSVQALEPLLIPKADEKQKNQIEMLVDECLGILNENSHADISKIEKEIDTLIFRLFNFNNDEVNYVSNSYESIANGSQ
jgi:hypothetical protein